MSHELYETPYDIVLADGTPKCSLVTCGDAKVNFLGIKRKLDFEVKDTYKGVLDYIQHYFGYIMVHR